MNRRIVLDDDAITTKKGPSVIRLHEPSPIDEAMANRDARFSFPRKNLPPDNPFEKDVETAFETIRYWVGEATSEDCANYGHDVRPSTSPNPLVLMECARCGMHVEERQVHPLFGKIYGK